VIKVVRLSVGKQAPIDADCIRIEQSADMIFNLTRSALCIGADDAESVSIVGGPTFGSAEKAEEAGLIWASNVRAEQLIVIAATLEHPLELIEIHKPG